jgi:hypothetical protein
VSLLQDWKSATGICLFSHNEAFVRKHKFFPCDASGTDKRTHLQQRKFDEHANRTRLSGKEELQSSLK